MEKKIFTIILASAVVFSINAQNIDFPDAAFKSELINHSPTIDTDGDGEISISEAESFDGGILVSQDVGISDLTGIEYFINLTQLYVSSNNITSVDLSQNLALETITLHDNQLTDIDVTPFSSLYFLNVTGNQLTSLDVSQNSNLQTLYCAGNQLASIDVSHNPNLNFLHCAGNQLTSLDVSQNPALEELYCGAGDMLTSLDVSFNPSLIKLLCPGSQLESLNLANGNNVNFTLISANTNPDLHCIKVDNAEWSNNNWYNGTNFDDTQFFYDEENECPYTVGITEYSPSKQLTAYPNPTNGIIYFHEAIDVELTDILGQKILEDKNTESIDISEQPNGIYFITVYDKKGQKIQQNKIVKN